MATYQVRTPDGHEYEIDAPDDVPEQQVLEHFKAQMGQQKQPEQSFGQWAGDQAKFLGGRLANAAISVPGLPADLLGLEMRGLDYLAGRQTPTENPLEPFTSHSIRSGVHELASQGANAAGYQTKAEDFQPRDPRNTTEKYLGNAADFIGYGAGPGAFTKSALASAATGAAGLTATQEIAPDNPLVQIAGAVAGHRIPAAIASRGASILPTTRALLRGRNSQIDDELAAYQRLSDETGQPVSVMPGQLGGEYNIQQVFDALIARSPGGQPGVLRANESQAKLLDAALNKAAANPTGKLDVGAPSPTGTGSRVLSDFEASAQKFRSRQTKIENAFEKAIGADTRVPMQNTVQAIVKLRSRAASDPEIAKIVDDAYIKRVQDALAESGGTLSYSAARALKTDAGDLLPKSGMLSDVKGGQLKSLYGALAEDISSVAKSKGVGSQWDRYNKWASDTYDKTAKVYDRITKGREFDPERVADTVGRLDATSLKVAMRNLSPEGRSMVAGQMLLNAAKTKAAGAAAEDVGTSYTKFLGNLLEMKRRGTFDAAFGAPEFAPLRQTIDDVEKVSKSALRANKVAHDVSGATTIRGAAMGSIGALAFTGQVPAAAGLFGLTFLAPAAAGRLMRSKAYLNWISYANKAKPGEMRRVLQRLEMVAVRDRDPENRHALQQLLPIVEKLSAQPSNPSIP